MITMAQITIVVSFLLAVSLSLFLTDEQCAHKIYDTDPVLARKLLYVVQLIRVLAAVVSTNIAFYLLYLIVLSLR